METCHIFVIVEEVRMIFVIFAIVVLLVDPLKRRSQYHKVFILKQIFCIVILSLLSTLNKIYLLVIFVILICRQKLFQFSGNAWYANYGTKNDNFRDFRQDSPLHVQSPEMGLEQLFDFA